MDLWRKAFRAFVPHLGRRGLLRLWAMLAADSPDLIQGGSTVPPPMQVCAGWKAEQACPVNQAGMAHGLETVGELAEWFGRACHEADRALGECAGVRWFTTWWDEGPRDQMRPLLLAEVEYALGLGVDPSPPLTPDPAEAHTVASG